jgi:hypothetical protein
MSREWLDEAEASTDVIKFPTKMRHTRCELMGSKHDVGYEPSLGVNIIGSSLAKSVAAASSLSRSSKLLNIPSREPQRRLNNNMREVVKKEVLKLLHARLSIPYPIVNGSALFKLCPRREA